MTDWDLTVEPLTRALVVALREEVPDLDVEDEDVVTAQAEAILGRLGAANLARALAAAPLPSDTPATPKGPVEGWRWVAVLRALHAAGLAYEEQPEGVRAALAAGAAWPSDTPADGLYTVRRIENTQDDWWSVDQDGESIAIAGEDDARRIAAALTQEPRR